MGFLEQALDIFELWFTGFAFGQMCAHRGWVDVAPQRPGGPAFSEALLPVELIIYKYILFALKQLV